jgi:hypothetical protein
MRELRRFQDTVRGELDEVLHFQDADRDHTPPVVAPLPAVEAGTEPGPPAGMSSAAPPSGARAPSRFRAPGNPPRA